MIIEKAALSIAGSDSGGGAGIQADLKTFAAHNVYGCSVITSVTAQNTCGVSAVYNLPIEIISEQIIAVCSDFNLSAIKTGMLATPDIVRCVAKSVIDYNKICEAKKITKPYLIIDPVMVATSGDKLVQRDTIDVLQNEWLRLATLVTPNIDEAKILTGIDITCLSDMYRASEIIHKFGCLNVLLKGGHLNQSGECIDVLFADGKFFEFSMPYIKTNNTHGTGCTLASAITANLILGQSMVDSVKNAKEYLHNAIQKSRVVGKCSNPVFHEWKNFM